MKIEEDWIEMKLLSIDFWEIFFLIFKMVVELLVKFDNEFRCLVS